METTYEDFEVRDSAVAGKGVFTKRGIPADTYLYLKPRNTSIGVIYQESEIPEGFLHFCIAQADGTWKGPRDFDNIEPLWYLNHSEQPNAHLKDDGYYSLIDIPADTEILIDYGILGEPEDKKEDFYRK